MSDIRVADLRGRLEAVSSEKLSTFILEAVRAKLHPAAKMLELPIGLRARSSGGPALLTIGNTLVANDETLEADY